MIKLPTKLRGSFIIVFVTAIFTAGVFIVKLNDAGIVNELRVQMLTMPSSLDPADFDYFHNQSLQCLTHTRLTSMYRGRGVPSAQLAESWSANKDNTEWRLDLRSDVYFASGKRVDAQAAASSLKRIIYRLTRVKTKNIFVNSLVGIEKLDSANGDLAGLVGDGNRLVIKLTKPVPNLLEVLSSGIFAIVDPVNFEPKTGQWLPKSLAEVSGAGPYKISTETKKVIQLRRKDNYPIELHSKSAASHVHYFLKNTSSLKPHLFYGPSDSEDVPSDQYVFHGRGSRHIMYAQFVPWRVKSSPFSNPAIREFVKDIFLKELRSAGFETTNSFFPLVMQGISEPKDSTAQSLSAEDVRGIKIRFSDSRPSGSKKVDATTDAFVRAVEKVGMVPVPVKKYSLVQVYEVSSSSEDAYDLDIAFLGTGISISDPIADIRLMFSFEGVNLPDVDGSVAKILENPAFDPQSVNQKIADQSAAIPMVRYDLGMWAVPELDLSDYNTLKSPGELQWIGVK